MLARMLILPAAVGHFVLGLDTNVPFSLKTARFRLQCLPNFGDYLDLLDCYFSHRSSVARTNPNTNSSLSHPCSCHRRETYHDIRATHGTALPPHTSEYLNLYFPHFATTVLCHRTHYTGTTTSPLDTLSARVNYRRASLPNFALPPDFTDYKLFLSVKEGTLRRLWPIMV